MSDAGSRRPNDIAGRNFVESTFDGGGSSMSSQSLSSTTAPVSFMSGCAVGVLVVEALPGCKTFIENMAASLAHLKSTKRTDN
jgi:hypothetical protein